MEIIDTEIITATKHNAKKNIILIRLIFIIDLKSMYNIKLSCL